MTAQPAIESFSPRQNEVLECALGLLVEGGDKALTTAGVARAANCSKESLYKWFGDRDGLLSAVITYQASKVRVRAKDTGMPDLAAFRGLLVDFAEDLLKVLAGDISLALNRLSIGQASREGSALGGLLLRQGRRPIEIRLGALLETGRAAGLVAFADTAEAYRTLYGLVVRDMHVRLLLGDLPSGEEIDLRRRSETAVDQFLRLFGADEKANGPA